MNLRKLVIAAALLVAPMLNPANAGTLDTVKQVPWTPVDRALSATMGKYWTNFARTGNPNGGDTPPWPAYAKDQILSLNTRDMAPIKTFASDHKCSFWAAAS